jgi:hypothetical protein
LRTLLNSGFYLSHSATPSAWPFFMPCAFSVYGFFQMWGWFFGSQ